jgi:hypothetical protein
MSKHLLELKNGVGLCSVPMWRGGYPAGCCCKPAYGEQKPCETYERLDGTTARRDGGYDGYVPDLACVKHGGPTKEESLNLCQFCANEFATCVSSPKFGCGKGNDNVYDCDGYKEKP